MPDVVGIFANRAVRAEERAARYVHQALSAKRDAITVFAVHVLATLTERQKLLQDEILIRFGPFVAKQ